MKNKGLKIFLSYHKDTPCYQSDIFQPIQVGSELSDNLLGFAISDNSKDNISHLNPYYCELTGHYWVLNNYLKSAEEEYIGFSHYRRLPDLLSISKEDFPSIYGIKYSSSLELFNDINKNFTIDYVDGYDIILPCSCYMYSQTVNPQLRENESALTLFEHYRVNHDIRLLELMKDIVTTYYPDYLKCLDECYESKKSHFFNIYIMKTSILKEFLEWEFDILDKIGQNIGGWEHSEFQRMAGFVGEILVNIWIRYNNNYSLGYVPLYMVDFESEYIEKVNEYHKNRMYDLELAELNNLLKIASDKFSVLLEILNTSLMISDNNYIQTSIQKLKEVIKTAEEYYQTACVLSQYVDFDSNIVCEFFTKSLTTNSPQKLYAQSFLNYTQRLHDISKIQIAWQYLTKFELSQTEKDNYNKFKKIQQMIK